MTRVFPNNEAASIRDALAAIQNLPTLPALVIKIMEDAANPDVSALDLAKHIAVDQSLSASLLRLVNSAYYGFNRNISSILDAVVLLGFTKVRDLVLTATAFKILPTSRSCFDRVQLWRHSIATAILAERISRIKRYPIQNGYYTAGLLHDLGKVCFDLVIPSRYEEVVRKARESGALVFEVEQNELGLDHGESGASLGEYWNLPSNVIAAMRGHHGVVEPSEGDGVVHVTIVADYLAYQAEMGETSNGRPPDKPDVSMGTLGLSEEIISQISKNVRESRDRIDTMLGILTST
ncbi:MAG TPA: HDOD domain-containing protein [Candidatus Hydrogenedentes bacterium]|nr:HDOD domain-containing protein [Candidatus Hydrogenedentota bacterium]HOL75777.1 HDOD domain-containing protein [Candidatus Hydrogenedentota bacterium]HPO84229.1 HDOD domain-containing protein [Candidatus Hydrogenedentota bacterium]